MGDRAWIAPITTDSGSRAQVGNSLRSHTPPQQQDGYPGRIETVDDAGHLDDVDQPEEQRDLIDVKPLYKELAAATHQHARHSLHSGAS